MDLDLILTNLATPPVLFFILGLIACLVKSDFELPPPILKFLSYYLLFCIGYKGGIALRENYFGTAEWWSMLAGVTASFIIPLIAFFIVKRKFTTGDAAAIAASYGSVGAVTFITSCSFLTFLNIPYGGHMIATLALMESPAIIIGLMLYRLYDSKTHPERAKADQEKYSWRHVLHEALCNGCVLILLGSLFIGYICACKRSMMDPFVKDIFYGMLCFYLLDLGIVAGRRLSILKKHAFFALSFGILFPFACAGAGVVIAKILNLDIGNALLLTVLLASPSYIAVPAVFRVAVPEANPSIYISLALGISFPISIIIGIPLYYEVLKIVLKA